MVEKRTCDYTGEDIEPGTGTMYVQVDGTVLHFKDSKAEKNFFMGREARDLEWTQAGQRAGPSSQSQPTPDLDEETAADEEAESGDDEPSDEADDAGESEETVDTGDADDTEETGDGDDTGDGDGADDGGDEE